MLGAITWIGVAAANAENVAVACVLAMLAAAATPAHRLLGAYIAYLLIISALLA